MRKCLLPLLLAALTMTFPVLSADEEAAVPDGVICPPGGPCILPSAGGAAAAEAEPLPANLPDTEPEIRQVDLEKEPWLVESVNLPANHPTLKRDKVVFADKLLWTALPDTVEKVQVEKWLTPLPPESEMAGKYILIEVWATWCPPCRRSLNYLNWLAEHYKDDLVVVAICEMEEEKVRSMPGNHKIDDVRYSLAIDTGRRFANALNVTGIPHVVLIEPMLGGVIWEGMPTMPGHELDGKTLEKFFAAGKKLRSAGKFPAEPLIKFEVSEPTDEQRATRRHHESDIEDKVGEPSQD
ncbi:MAG: TlpA family protein disulfide reductase [Thermoguttaceae bacterium]|nr:TlpA family protein disulfide reductase [Thermoguttaceae bacterium]